MFRAWDEQICLKIEPYCWVMDSALQVRLDHPTNHQPKWEMRFIFVPSYQYVGAKGKLPLHSLKVNWNKLTKGRLIGKKGVRNLFNVHKKEKNHRSVITWQSSEVWMLIYPTSQGSRRREWNDFQVKWMSPKNDDLDQMSSVLWGRWWEGEGCEKHCLIMQVKSPRWSVELSSEEQMKSLPGCHDDFQSLLFSSG